MTTLRILAVAALAVIMLAPDAMAQRRGGGGAVSGGMRGAVVGGMVGGESGASTAPKSVWPPALPEASLNGLKTAMPCMRKTKPVPNMKTLRPIRVPSTRISAKRRRRS